MNTDRRDRLYELLPPIYRQLDADHDEQLRDFLRVIAEQVNVVEDDVAQLYANWFIETCADWAVPYIGDLIGFAPVTAAGMLARGETEQERRRNRILAPRRELANTLRNRARRGTLALLELLANDSAGRPARAVEFFNQLAAAQSLNFLRHDRAQAVDLRNVDALDLLDGPFDTLAHSVDVRRSTSTLTPGRHNIPSAGEFVWRLQAFPITLATAYARQTGEVQYTFSALSNNAPIFTRAQRETDPDSIASERELPVPIRRRALDRNVEAYYGNGKSFAIYRDKPEPSALVPASEILAADLTDWTYSIPPGRVAVDPVLGRIAFADDVAPAERVWVSYRYGFSAAIGGGEYRRPIAQADGAVLYRVSRTSRLDTVAKALREWTDQKPLRAVIEIADSDTYVEPIDVHLPPKHYLQIRAANGKRPVLGMADWYAGTPEAVRIHAGEGSRFVLDGLLIAGGPLEIRADGKADVRTRIAIRHCTLVPGWSLHEDCRPRTVGRPSLELERIGGRVTIDASILGAIEIDSRRAGDPLRVEISDAIVDAISHTLPAIGGRKQGYANAALRIARCTIVGETRAHSLPLAENSIFTGELSIVRRQEGCVRFCHVPAHSRTPRRYRCQPDRVEAPLRAAHASEAKLDVVRERVRPQFDSLRYGSPEYARLALAGPREIARGADDESEMGVFHDVFAPQRAANLRARLDEYTPSSMDTGIFYAD